MPIYEYKCSSCGHLFEKMESINSNVTVQECLSCGAEANRQISQSAFHLKGGGWFSSDYGGKSVGNAQTCPAKSDNKNSAEACASCPAAAAK